MMLCPMDNQPCTMDHSVPCYESCSKIREEGRRRFPRDPNSAPSTDSTVRRTLSIGCALSMVIVMLAVSITIALLILKVGRGL